MRRGDGKFVVDAVLSDLRTSFPPSARFSHVPVEGVRQQANDAKACEAKKNDIEHRASPKAVMGDFTTRARLVPERNGEMTDTALPIDNTAQGDWGLTGWSKLMANLGAIGVVCTLLVFSFYTLRETHREDVAVFREEMKEFRAEMRAQRDHDGEMRRLTNGLISKNQASLEETLRIVGRMGQDVTLLVATLKKGT